MIGDSFLKFSLWPLCALWLIFLGSSDFLQMPLKARLLGFVEATGLGDAARHTVVAGTGAFVVEAVDGEIAVADVLDELADEVVDDCLRVLPTAGWFFFVDSVGEGAFGIVAGAHAPVAGLKGRGFAFEDEGLGGFDVNRKLKLLAGEELVAFEFRAAT